MRCLARLSSHATKLCGENSRKRGFERRTVRRTPAPTSGTSDRPGSFPPPHCVLVLPPPVAAADAALPLRQHSAPTWHLSEPSHDGFSHAEVYGMACKGGLGETPEPEQADGCISSAAVISLTAPASISRRSRRACCCAPPIEGNGRDIPKQGSPASSTLSLSSCSPPARACAALRPCCAEGRFILPMGGLVSDHAGTTPGSSSQRGNLGFSLSVTVVPMLSSALRSFIHSTTSDRSRFTMPASRFTCILPRPARYASLRSCTWRADSGGKSSKEGS
jgi:hypothetical protein